MYLPNVESYLQGEGLKRFTEPMRFWHWANGRLGTKMALEFTQMMNRRATDLSTGTTQFYDFIGQQKQAQAAASFEYSLLVEILRWVEPRLPEQGQIVEFGCHTGLLTRYYSLARPKAKVIGIDLSQTAIETAHKLANQSKFGNLLFYNYDLRQQDTLHGLQSDCIVSGRVLSELMTPVRLLRRSWEDYKYQYQGETFDQDTLQVLKTCTTLLKPGGSFLITERISTLDRLERLWNLLIEAGFTPEKDTLTPVTWTDIAGSHNTWFFQAGYNLESNRPEELQLPFREIPLPSREDEATGNPTRLLFDGLLAWETWNELQVEVRRLEGMLSWPEGQQVHYELGILRGGLNFTYIASNTDIHLLTLFLPQELHQVQRDLEEYIKQLQRSGGI